MAQRSRFRHFRITAMGAATLAAAILFSSLNQIAQAQTYTVLHNFTGEADGGNPVGGLTSGYLGNLFGATSQAWGDGGGTAFQLSNKYAVWTFNIIYRFNGYLGAGPDSALLSDGIVFFGTTNFGGGICDGQSNVCGTVYLLERPTNTICPTSFCLWTPTLIHAFTGGSDGWEPGSANLTTDYSSGTLYGVTQMGGANDSGVVYALQPNVGDYLESILFSLPTMNSPINSGVVLVGESTLYGETLQGVYQLSPSDSGWTYTVLHAWQEQDGTHPYGGLIGDESGNFYGTTSQAGPDGGGTVFELTPSQGAWIFTVLHAFAGPQGPHAGLAMDAAGNLYGTNYENGAYSDGSVFKLTHTENGWTYSDLHDFTGNDGALPTGNLVIDANGNVFGTTSQGGPNSCPGLGTNGCGVVWEITP